MASLQPDLNSLGRLQNFGCQTAACVEDSRQ